jgi:class 3 adenylate cyclase
MAKLSHIFNVKPPPTLLRHIHIARTLDYILILCCIIAARSIHPEVNSPILWVTGFILLIAPHLIILFHIIKEDYGLKKKFEAIEFKAVYMDNFLCGFCIPLVYFHPPVTFALVLIPYVNLITIGGLNLFKKGFFWLPFGVLLGYLITENHLYSTPNSIMFSIACILIAAHTGSIVFINYRNTVKFNRTKIQLQKVNQEIQKERDRSEDLLLNILPVAIAKELKETGTAVAKQYKLATVLFTDFKEFTEKSAKLSAKELVEEVHECFKAFDAICDKYQIEKIKTMGDAYMAAGGLPVPSNNSTQNTVLAGLEMAAFITKRKKERQVQSLITFEMRVGIHTGPLVAGIVGVKKFQYDIWGDSVNTSSRLESNGEVGKVNISKRTYEIIKEDPRFTFEYRGKIHAKGKGEIPMYFVELKQSEA